MLLAYNTDSVGLVDQILANLKTLQNTHTHYGSESPKDNYSSLNDS